MKNQKSLIAGTHPSAQNLNQSDSDVLVAKAEELCLSPLKAIANPMMLQGLSLKKQSTFKPTSETAINASPVGTSPSTTNSSMQNKKSSMQSSDFKIKKRVGVEQTRNQALNNSRLSAYSSELADSDIEPERHESISRLIESSKMRRLQDAKRNWSRNHGANSPFRINFSNDCSSERGSASDLGFQNQNVVKIQNLKLVDSTANSSAEHQASPVKSSTFSKHKEVQHCLKGIRPQPAQSSFKRSNGLPKLQATPKGESATATNSPTVRANKRNFEAEQILEPNSPIVTLNHANSAIV